MKTLQEFVHEKLKVKKAVEKEMVKPRSKAELRILLKERIKDNGYECDLNDIDISDVDDLSYLFDISFNGDVSQWDTSNVTNMEGMFVQCEDFNQDISDWNVSKVKNMANMFGWCAKFNQDISGWDVSNVESFNKMFYNCTSFNQDLSNWKVAEGADTRRMFSECTSLKNTPKWYKE